MSIWNSIRTLARRSLELGRFEAENRRRIEALENYAGRSNDGIYGYLTNENPTEETGTWADVYVFGYCYGNPPVANGDIRVMGIRESTNEFGYEYYLYNVYPIIDGYARIFFPSYPEIYDEYGNQVFPVAKPFSFSYWSSVNQSLSSSISLYNIYMQANRFGVSNSPSVYVSGSGSGASLNGLIDINGNLGIATQGSGYGVNTGISFDGYYNSGLTAVPQIGYVGSASISATGSGFSSLPAVAVVAGGRNATIRGVATSNYALPSWTIVDGGDGMGADGATIAFPVTAPTGLGTKRTATVVGTCLGNSISALTVVDPGLAYVAGTTITGTASRIGSGASLVLGPLSSGHLTTVSVTGIGSGYFLNPTATITGGGGSGASISLGNVTGVSKGTIQNPIDRWGCFGICSKPSKLTGIITSQFGTSQLVATGLGAIGFQVVVFSSTQVALGQVINEGTFPNGYLANNAYYPVTFYLQRDATANAAYWLTFSGGVLTSVIIKKSGYGYYGNPSVILSIARWLPTFTVAARFHFTCDLNGSVTGYAIDVAGSGYRTAGGSLFSGTLSGVSEDQPDGFPLYESPGAEYQMTCYLKTDISSIDGKTRPTGGGIFPTTSATVRCSSYTCNPLRATFDFTGTAVDGPAFQSGSKVVTYDGS